MIFGANASGKTSLIKAFQEMFQSITNKYISSEFKIGTINRQYFKLNSQGESEPTEFELIFIYNGVRYQYGYTYNNDCILNEWLYAYPNERCQKWFERSYDIETRKYNFKFSEKYFKGPKVEITNAVNEKMLFFTMANFLGQKQIQDVTKWILSENVAFFMPNSGIDLGRVNEIISAKTKEEIDSVTRFLRELDIDVENIAIDKNIITNKKTSFVQRKFSDSNQLVEFEMEDESSGTISKEK